MASKIRVYELARELGLTNKETLDLCEALGIGVRSHSSSIVDAQADRVRRKADAEGLRREPRTEEPDEPAPAAPVPAARAPEQRAARSAPHEAPTSPRPEPSTPPPAPLQPAPASQQP
ncbi:MAG: translation initiation factor IF-2 N-terminal domain-containing protein, partial [Actinomycetota bacterium]|nr:translation initiation factor IF-2 N-terminal domain-containing protein [Actinomycetota bacterium]